MNMTNKEYKEYSDSHQPHSKLLKNMFRAFWTGELICFLGQLINNLYMQKGLNKLAAASLGSVTLILLGAILTGIGVYDRIAKYAGGGSLVPITGFANSVVSPALEFKTEGFVTGTAAKMFVIAGPVIVFGISASVVYGLILCLIGA